MELNLHRLASNEKAEDAGFLFWSEQVSRACQPEDHGCDIRSYRSSRSVRRRPFVQPRATARGRVGIRFRWMNVFAIHRSLFSGIMNVVCIMLLVCISSSMARVLDVLVGECDHVHVRFRRDSLVDAVYVALCHCVGSGESVTVDVFS